MPLIKDVTAPETGAVARHHRIDEYRVLRTVGIAHSRARGVNLSAKGSVFVNVGGYVSESAMLTGSGPILQQSFSIRFGADIPNPLPAEAGAIIVIRNDEPTLTDIYTALKATAAFDGASDDDI